MNVVISPSGINVVHLNVRVSPKDTLVTGCPSLKIDIMTLGLPPVFLEGSDLFRPFAKGLLE